MTDLAQFPREKLCEWHSIFNVWRWPNDFPEPKPENFDSLPKHEFLDYAEETRLDIITPRMEQIEASVPTDELLQWYHINVLGLSQEESDKHISRRLNRNLEEMLREAIATNRGEA